MKNIYVTWHYTTHGVAYLKHVLSAFYTQKSITGKIGLNQLDQVSLNEMFDNPDKDGFVFDKVIYLTAPQNAFDKLSTRRVSYKRTILEDKLIQEYGLLEIYEDILSQDNLCYKLKKETEYVKVKYSDKLSKFEKSVWRNIQHYPIEEQINWLINHSNFNNVYKGRFEEVSLKVDDLRDEHQISTAIYKWILNFRKNTENANLFINISLGSSETQVVWYILSESGKLPSNTRFLKTYDDKTDKLENRFKRFSIIEVDTNISASIKTNLGIYEGTKSENRLLVDRKMNVLINTGFSILLIGERGTGKSQIASMAKEKMQKSKKEIPLIQANCASFEDDSMAEATLFGYKKGSFTGANIDKGGLFSEADNGILFLDEIHHLSKGVQAKLMKALQTNEKNKMLIRPLGSNIEKEVECRLIFATNKSILELKDCLLPDFYDRIVQHVINIPALRETTEDREKDWEKVWNDLNFKENSECPKDSRLINWLKNLPLYGNFRDLQKIAIYYNAYNQYDDETKKMLIEKTAYEYAKNEFEKYHSPETMETFSKYNFNTNQTTKEMIADYLYALQEWSVTKFKGKSKAINHYKNLGDTVCEKTFSNWKNKAL
jgi:transcriptional regulator with AAA-type ATPase domain